MPLQFIQKFINVPPKEKELRAILIQKCADELLKIVGEFDSKRKEEFEKKTVQFEGWQRSFLEVIRPKTASFDLLVVFWQMVEDDMLKYLAYQSWCLTKKIIEGLNPNEPDGTHIA
jgi:hypothetical protein